VRLIACLSWFDEPAPFLAELVASLADAGVDHLVAVDGSYGAYPNSSGSSGSEQACLIHAAAQGAGMGVSVHCPQIPWAGNEIEKRTFLFAAGHLVAEPDTDWLWIADGDEVVTTAHGLRDKLEATSMDVAEVELWTRAGDDEWSRQPIRKLFRAQRGGIRVENHHARYVAADGRVLWDSGEPLAQVPADQFWDVRVRHRPECRPHYRNMKRWKYYERRKQLALEAD
jgi:hypothetical protein